MGRKRSTAHDYIDHDKFKEAMNEYEDLKKADENHEASNYILESVMDIAKNFIKSTNFGTQHADVEALIGEAIYSCVRALPNYRREIKENPFAYFTQICYYAYIGELQKQQKEFKGRISVVQRSTEYLDIISEIEGNRTGSTRDTDAVVNKLLEYSAFDMEPKKEKKKATRKPLYLSAKDGDGPKSLKDIRAREAKEKEDAERESESELNSNET